MYKRSSYLLSNVTRHLANNLYNNARDNSSLALLMVKPNENFLVLANTIFRRHYSDEKNEDPVAEHELMRNPEEEARIKLEKYLVDPENQKMLKRIELEVEIRRQNGEKVPEVMKPQIWWELLNLKSFNQRRRYIEFCWKVEMKKLNSKVKKLKRKENYSENPPPPTEYKLGRNTMFLRFYDTTMHHFYHGRLMNAILFGQPIVFDCGYNDHMTRMEAKYCARQLNFSFSTNRVHDNPFDLYFCNTDFKSVMMQVLYRVIPTILETDFPINVKQESYTELFDKDRLVYLSPHATEVMKTFDHNAIYIIGAYVDKASNEPLSQAKAKKDGIKCQRLPLEHYLQWGTSSAKNLTLNAVLNILLELRHTGSWAKALEMHVPSRKLLPARKAAEDRLLRKLFKEEKMDIDIDNFSINNFKKNFRTKFNRIVQERNSNYATPQRTKSNFINQSDYENTNLRSSSYATFKKE